MDYHEPARSPSIESDVWVPVGQTLFTFIFGTAALGMGAAAVTLVVPAWLRFMLIGGAIVLLVAWLAIVYAIGQTLWRYKVEQITGIDINRDGRIGPPTAHPFPVGSNPAPLRNAEDAWHKTAAWFVLTCFRLGKDGVPRTGEKALIGRRKPDGTKLDIKEYERLREALIGGRWAAWKNPAYPKGGWEFAAGLAPNEIIQGLQRYRH